MYPAGFTKAAIINIFILTNVYVKGVAHSDGLGHNYQKYRPKLDLKIDSMERSSDYL